jgi:hypothetical protein
MALFRGDPAEKTRQTHGSYVWCESLWDSSASDPTDFTSSAISTFPNQEEEARSILLPAG